MDDKLISIIVPVYNVGKYIEKCIVSIMKQSYGEIEIILVNDGSTDNSGEICDKLSTLDNRIQVINIENAGVSNARNIGIKKAKGEWIVFIDGDDYIEQSYIESLFELSHKYPKAEILMVGYYSELNDIKIENHFFRKSQVINKERKADLIKMCLGIDVENTKGKTNIGVPWAKMYKKSLITDNQITFPIELRKMQDAVFNIEAYHYAEQIVYLDKPLYYYRVWGGSVCHRYFSDYQQTAELLIYALEKNLRDKEYLGEYQDVLNAKKMMLFIETIKLSYLPKENRENNLKKIVRIKKLAGSSLYKNAFDINNKYLTRNQKMVCLLIHCKLYCFVYFIMFVKNKFKGIK